MSTEQQDLIQSNENASASTGPVKPDHQNVEYFFFSCNWNTSRKLLKKVIATININM
jgi:hypothetical protein